MSTVDYPKINEWLTQVENEMRMTLAQNLASAVADIKQFKHGSIDTPRYLQWCDKYQAQLVVLAAQISWSEEVMCLCSAIYTAWCGRWSSVRCLQDFYFLLLFVVCILVI